MKRLKSFITIQKLAENLRDFEIGPSDDFFVNIVEKLYVQGVFGVVTGTSYTETI